jgi:hypothetical protein
VGQHTQALQSVGKERGPCGDAHGPLRVRGPAVEVWQWALVTCHCMGCSQPCTTLSSTGPDSHKHVLAGACMTRGTARLH